MSLEETSARIVFLAVLPEYRRRGIGVACIVNSRSIFLFLARSPSRAYALIDGPVIPFLGKIGYLPGKQYLWMDRMR